MAPGLAARVVTGERRPDGDRVPRHRQRRHVEAIARIESNLLGERSAGERITRLFVRRVGTPASLVVHAVVVVAWLAWNAGLPGGPVPFDRYPFNLLALAASLEAILLGLCILASQRRFEHEADRRAHLTLQINMMAELEAAKMLQMLDRLCRHVGVEGLSEELLHELTSDTDPATIAETLRRSMPSER